MAKRKRFTPSKTKKTTFKPERRAPSEFPRTLIKPPIQPKLEGFTTPELEEIEGAAEMFKTVADRVKLEKAELQKERDSAEAELIAVMQRHRRTSLVIGGYSISILDKKKAKVEGAPKLKSEREEDKERVEHEDIVVELTPIETAALAARAGSQNLTPTELAALEARRGGSAVISAEEMRRIAELTKPESETFA